MRRWWVSWWHNPSRDGDFELKSPWWVTGYRHVDQARTDGSVYGEDVEQSICAAVLAESEDAAVAEILNAYDEYPGRAGERRFVEERPDDWSPYSDRFPKVLWMQWPEDAAEDARRDGATENVPPEWAGFPDADLDDIAERRHEADPDDAPRGW